MLGFFPILEGVPKRLSWTGTAYSDGTDTTIAPSKVPTSYYPFKPYDGRRHNTKGLPKVPTKIYFPVTHRFQPPEPPLPPPPPGEITLPDILLAAEDWEKDLIQHMSCTMDPAEALSLLRTTKEIKCVSDGGANEEKMTGSFGVIITIPGHSLILQNGGHVSGLSPSYFRAKATAMLSGCCLVNILF